MRLEANAAQAGIGWQGSNHDSLPGRVGIVK